MGEKRTESVGNPPLTDASSSAPESESLAYPPPSQDWIQQDGKRPDDISRGARAS